MRPHTTHHRQAARRAVETEREAYELACEADAADAAAPYDALEPTCCGCVVCCCSACDDGYRSARVTEAREERYRREWTEARRRRSALGVGLLSWALEGLAYYLVLVHEHRYCGPCSIAREQSSCIYGCGRPAEPITLPLSGVTVPGAACEQCSEWAPIAYPEMFRGDLDD